MRRLGSLRWLSSVCAALVLVTLSGGPAWAADPSASHQTAATRRPDGWVRYYGFYSSVDGYTLNTKPWLGKNIYNTTGHNQTVSKNEAGSYLDGEFFVFKIVVQNDGSNSDSFKVTAPGSTYEFESVSDITAAVVAGTYTTPTLGSGAKQLIWVFTPPGDSTQLITVTSVGDNTKKDAVKIITNQTCGC